MPTPLFITLFDLTPLWNILIGLGIAGLGLLVFVTIPLWPLKYLIGGGLLIYGLLIVLGYVTIMGA